jgi:tetrahydromethanopterin S-methyltransferase subunit E
MKTYVTTTGVVFGLLVLAHVWRAVVEGPRVATDPAYVVATLVAAALSLWAWRLVRIS